MNDEISAVRGVARLEHGDQARCSRVPTDLDGLRLQVLRLQESARALRGLDFQQHRRRLRAWYPRGIIEFLNIARGSAGEFRSMLCLLTELLESDAYRAEVEELRSLSLSITRQLNAWLDSLKKTKSVGHRLRTVEKREAQEKAKRRDEFLDYLRRVQEGTAGDADGSRGEQPPPP